MWNYSFTLHVRLNTCCKIGCQHARAVASLAHRRIGRECGSSGATSVLPRYPWKDKKRMIHKKGKKWKESFKVRKLHCVDTDNISNVIKRQLNQQ